MESRWRLAVWETGWNLGPYKFVGVFLSQPTVAVAYRYQPPNREYRILLNVGGDQGWVETNIVSYSNLPFPGQYKDLIPTDSPE